MPTICPRDCKTCIDDMCRGSGICGLSGHEMLERCQFCGEVCGEFIECRCDLDPPVDSDPWEEERLP